MKSFDQATIEIESEQDGFLRAKVFLSKPGVYPYLLSDGSLSGEALIYLDFNYLFKKSV